MGGKKPTDTQEPIAFCLHLFQGRRSGHGQLWRRCEKLKGNFSCPANITPLLRGEAKEEHFVRTKGKVREGKSGVNEKVEPAVWTRLIFTTRVLRTASVFGHNQTLNLPLQEHQRCCARVDFFFSL